MTARHRRFLSSENLKIELELQQTSDVAVDRGHGRHRIKPDYEGSNIVEMSEGTTSGITVSAAAMRTIEDLKALKFPALKTVDIPTIVYPTISQEYVRYCNITAGLLATGWWEFRCDEHKWSGISDLVSMVSVLGQHLMWPEGDH